MQRAEIMKRATESLLLESVIELRRRLDELEQQQKRWMMRDQQRAKELVGLRQQQNLLFKMVCLMVVFHLLYPLFNINKY